MSLLNKLLASIEESDLLNLLDNEVRESKTIEYKEMLPGNSDSDKKEFLADVSSVANAAGGDLIYGIKETAGLPTEITGCDVTDVDAEIRRLDSIIQAGLSPRIPGVSVRAVPVRASAFVILIRIPKSWASPHMITFKEWARFYARNSAGKYRLDVSELRAAFLLSETTSERIRQFRINRLSKMIAGEGPVVLGQSAKMVLHIIPFSAFDPAAKYDTSSLLYNTSNVRPLYPYLGGTNSRHNFDGFLVYAQADKATPVESYLQVFRNGIIEAVDVFGMRDRDATRTIPIYYENELLETIPHYLLIQEKLGVEPPLFIMLSFLNVIGRTITSQNFGFVGHPIDRDMLDIPELMVESYKLDLAEVLRPIFDAVWNAAGWPKSMNYDDAGNRRK